MNDGVKHTSLPWEIDWYECREGEKLLWRMARSIGPLSPDHNHWAGWTVCETEADVQFAARAINSYYPLLEALEVAVEWRDKLAANPESREAWEALVEEDGCLDNEARAAIEKAKD